MISLLANPVFRGILIRTVLKVVGGMLAMHAGISVSNDDVEVVAGALEGAAGAAAVVTGVVMSAKDKSKDKKKGKTPK